MVQVRTEAIEIHTAEGARMAPSLECVVCFCGLAAGDARVSCGAGHALCADCCAGYLRQKVRGAARRGGARRGDEGRGKASPGVVVTTRTRAVAGHVRRLERARPPRVVHGVR